MANPNEIGSLQKIMIKPTAWRITQKKDGNFLLLFTYCKPSRRAEFANVVTRRGQVKEYKKADSCLKDIARVQTEAMIFADLNLITNQE